MDCSTMMMLTTCVMKKMMRVYDDDDIVVVAVVTWQMKRIRRREVVNDSTSLHAADCTKIGDGRCCLYYVRGRQNKLIKIDRWRHVMIHLQRMIERWSVTFMSVQHLQLCAYRYR